MKPKQNLSYEINFDNCPSINHIIFPAISSLDNSKNIIKLKSSDGIKFYKKNNILKVICERLLSNNNELDMKNEYFQDQQFPNSLDSLYGPGKTSINSTYDEDLKSLSEAKTWRNVNDLYNPIAITNNNFSPFDLVQGALSDCYYLSALASIAKFPELIMKLFVKIDLELLLSSIKSLQDLEILNSEEFKIKIFGAESDYKIQNYFENLIELNNFYIKNYKLIQCFILRIRLHGEWNYILIDGYLPTYRDYPSLIFARSNSSDLWVSLLEKVWAKVLEGYYETSLGSPIEGFLSLTDSPTEVITHKYLEHESELWHRTLGSIKKEWILACIIQLKADQTKNYKEIGLITNHCYSIIRLVEVKFKGEIIKLILLRNPHGHSNYSGKFSDLDSRWTKELKNLCNFDEKDSASFFMSFEEYFKYFDHTFICKYDHDKTYKSFKISKNMISNKTGVFILMKVCQSGEVIITLHQKYKRIYKKGYKSKVIQLLIFKLLPKNQNKISSISNDLYSDIENKYDFQYICGSNNNRSVNIQNIFKSGIYLIYAGLNYTENICGFVLSSYAEKNVNENIEFNLLNFKDEEINKTNLCKSIDIHNIILENLLVCICRSYKNIKKDYYSFEDVISLNEKSYKIVSLNELDNGFGIIFIENKSKNVTINSKLIIRDIFGLKCQNVNESQISQNNSEYIINFQTKSMSYKLIYFKKIKMKCGFKVSFTETLSYTREYLKLNIKRIGDKKEILINKLKSGVLIYSISHGNGYFFLIENTSKKNVIFKLVFTKLENLDLNKIKLNETIESTLAPGKTIEYNFSSINDKLMSNSVIYKYAASFK